MEERPQHNSWGLLGHDQQLEQLSQLQLTSSQLRRCDSEKLSAAAASSSSFSSPLYRGFLLRHSPRRSRDQFSPPGGQLLAAARLAAAKLEAGSGSSPASHKHVLTPREVKNRSRRKTMVTSIHTIF